MIDLETPHPEFPEDKIILLDGTTLDCYLKAVQPETLKDDNIRLDTTGQYLSFKQKEARKQEIKHQRDEDEKFFVEHAHFFLAHAREIFSDSRMFLAHVPITSGLAYVGTSGFWHPTLGIYLEWWLNGEEYFRKDEKGRDALTYYIAGSPLSGCNKCSRVYADGSVEHFSFSRPLRPFYNVWRTFIKVNGRYTYAKQIYEAYTIREVYDLLSAADSESALSLETKIQLREGSQLRSALRKVNKAYDNLSAKFRALCLKHYQQQLAEFKTEYYRRKAETDLKLKEVSQMHSNLKARFKNKEFTQKQYQQMLDPIFCKKSILKNALADYKKEQIATLTQNDDITQEMILDYLGA